MRAAAESRNQYESKVGLFHREDHSWLIAMRDLSVVIDSVWSGIRRGIRIRHAEVAPRSFPNIIARRVFLRSWHPARRPRIRKETCGAYREPESSGFFCRNGDAVSGRDKGQAENIDAGVNFNAIGKVAYSRPQSGMGSPFHQAVEPSQRADFGRMAREFEKVNFNACAQTELRLPDSSIFLAGFCCSTMSVRGSTPSTTVMKTARKAATDSASVSQRNCC